MSVAPLDFSDTEGLRRSMQGAGVLYNTYWVRFGRGRTTFEQAVENSCHPISMVGIILVPSNWTLQS